VDSIYSYQNPGELGMLAQTPDDNNGVDAQYRDWARNKKFRSLKPKC
jgi:hypothetical protein